MWIVRIIFWIQAFISPTLLLGLIGVFIGSERATIVLLIIGAVIGIFVAEYIRRKIGLDIFFARIYGPNQMDEKYNKKKDEPT